MSEKQYFTKANLKLRGWTDGLIWEFLGSPDSQTAADGWGTAAANTWDAKRVQDAEASSGFLAALEKSLARRKVNKRLIDHYERNRRLGPEDFGSEVFGNAISLFLDDNRERKKLTLEEELDKELRRSITDWSIQNYCLPKFASLTISNRVLKSTRSQECRPATEEEQELYSLHELPLPQELLFSNWNGAQVMSYHANKAKTSILPHNGTYLVRFPCYPSVVFSNHGNGFYAFPTRTTLAGRFERQFLGSAEYKRQAIQPLSEEEAKRFMSMPEFSRLRVIWSKAWYPEHLRRVRDDAYWKLVHGTLLLCALQAEDGIHQLFFEKVKQAVGYQAKKKNVPFYQKLWKALFASK
ncbi:MAG: hypothetical protein ACK493_01350 [Planctomycetota bacterium]